MRQMNFSLGLIPNHHWLIVRTAGLMVDLLNGGRTILIEESKENSNRRVIRTCFSSLLVWLSLSWYWLTPLSVNQECCLTLVKIPSDLSIRLEEGDTLGKLEPVDYVGLQYKTRRCIVECATVLAQEERKLRLLRTVGHTFGPSVR